MKDTELRPIEALRKLRLAGATLRLCAYWPLRAGTLNQYAGVGSLRTDPAIYAGSSSSEDTDQDE